MHSCYECSNPPPSLLKTLVKCKKLALLKYQTFLCANDPLRGSVAEVQSLPSFSPPTPGRNWPTVTYGGRAEKRHQKLYATGSSAGLLMWRGWGLVRSCGRLGHILYITRYVVIICIWILLSVWGMLQFGLTYSQSFGKWSMTISEHKKRERERSGHSLKLCFH